MVDFIIIAVIVGLVAAVLIKMRRDKKSGKSSCGCNCGSCSQKGKCHE